MQINKKKVIKTITVEESEYVAADGRIFTSEQECLKYEDTLTNATAILDSIETIHELDGCFPLNGCEASEEHSYFWFRPKTKAEVDALNTCSNASDYDRIGLDAINQWICVELDYEEAFWGYTLLSDCMEHSRNFFGKFGYDVSFTEAPSEHEKCTAYHTEYGKPECWGTKERESCACNGDCKKCDFYPEVRMRAAAKASNEPNYSAILRSAMNWEAEGVADSSDLLEIFRDHWGLSKNDIQQFGYGYLFDAEG